MVEGEGVECKVMSAGCWFLCLMRLRLLERVFECFMELVLGAELEFVCICVLSCVCWAVCVGCV